MNRRLLLVEDDPTTLAYLVEASRPLGIGIDTASTLGEALRIATTRTHDLWLFDARLPDGSGIELLSRLRAQELGTPALAHTAARERSALDPLVEAGFLEVLVKPIEASLWRATIRRFIGHTHVEHDMPDGRRVRDRGPMPGCIKLPVWSDERAEAALNGRRDHVHALRRLFLAELPAQRDAIVAGGADVRGDHLHRLRASCAFVGALRLDAAVQALMADPDGAMALERLRDAVQDTLDAGLGPAQS